MKIVVRIARKTGEAVEAGEVGEETIGKEPKIDEAFDNDEKNKRDRQVNIGIRTRRGTDILFLVDGPCVVIVFNTNSIIFNTQSISFNTKFISYDTKFIIFNADLRLPP